LIVGVSDRFPIFLNIDDLQWGDIDSARLLQQISSGDGAPRLLAILSYRSEYEEASPCLNELFPGGSAGASTAVAGRWRELTVDAMTTAQCEALAVALFDPICVDVQEYSSQIVRQSAGSAYLTIELAPHVNQGGDLVRIGTDLDQVLWRRTLGLPNPLQQLLRTLAIAGHPTRLRHLLQAAQDQMSPADATISTRDMTRLRLENFVWATGFGQDDQIEIFHDRLRESIIAHLSEDELKSRSVRLAGCFEVSGDVDADDIA
jgi:hypothetical protein